MLPDGAEVGTGGLENQTRAWEAALCTWIFDCTAVQRSYERHSSRDCSSCNLNIMGQNLAKVHQRRGPGPLVWQELGANSSSFCDTHLPLSFLNDFCQLLISSQQRKEPLFVPKLPSKIHLSHYLKSQNNFQRPPKVRGDPISLLLLTSQSQPPHPQTDNSRTPGPQQFTDLKVCEQNATSSDSLLSLSTFLSQ